ncbi:MAG: hypothetical protein H0X40_01965 [Chthoniobacterales bacterium]|nr:hypothetical protein [Chthoniobacterales bacterium]
MIGGLLRGIIPEYWRPIGHLVHLTRSRSGGKVASGPFAGLHYGEHAVGSAYIPKLLGSYERELALSIEESCVTKPDVVVDIGAAEGYYACGMARRLPNTRVIAFEMEAKGREALLEMVNLNHLTGRVEIRGKCEPLDLEEALAGARRPLIICDCEGYEKVLLDLTKVPALQRAQILVELHEFVVPGVTGAIKQHFEATHQVNEIVEEGRTRDDYPYRDFYTRFMPKSYLAWAPSEWRPEQMSWLWMMPRLAQH